MELYNDRLFYIRFHYYYSFQFLTSPFLPNYSQSFGPPLLFSRSGEIVIVKAATRHGRDEIWNEWGRKYWIRNDFRRLMVNRKKNVRIGSVIIGSDSIHRDRVTNHLWRNLMKWRKISRLRFNIWRKNGWYPDNLNIFQTFLIPF